MKLNDIAEFVTDKISSSGISLDRYVTTDSLLQNRRGRETAQNLPPMPCALTHYRRGDVLVANIRPYLKKVWYADSEGGCSSDVLAFRVKNGHCPSFLYTVLMQDAFFDYAMSGAKGSKMPRGDKDQIMRYELPTFTPLEEENIGNMMVDIMSKINVNRQINDNLEAMAKQLYDYWFVQFDFPNEEGKPYKSSGGAMVWNENLKREIPQGWVVEKMGKCTNVLLGGTPDTNDNSLWGNGYNWLNSGEVAEFPILKSEKNITPKGLEKSATVLAPKGSVTLSITRHLRPSILCIDACINQSVVAILENDKISKEYIYPLLNRDIPRLMSLRTGAQQPHINKGTVEAINVILPPANIMGAYINKAESIYNAIFNNAKEVEELTKQRDELLPLLMNGQATINYHLSVFYTKR